MLPGSLTDDPNVGPFLLPFFDFVEAGLLCVFDNFALPLLLKIRSISPPPSEHFCGFAWKLADFFVTYA